ncbi:hypothetical protein J6590_016514 [Homalodisca vitripennis]|nr:hypothetical protein J6590_016514 [Homalodisca vitripennis]
MARLWLTLTLQVLVRTALSAGHFSVSTGNRYANIALRDVSTWRVNPGTSKRLISGVLVAS